MKTTIAYLVGALALSLGAEALAQGSGFYGGLGIGRSKAKFQTGDFTTRDPTIAEGKEDTDTGFKFFAGYQLNKYIGAELSWTSLGKYNYSYTVPGFGTSRVHYKATSTAASAIGTIPLGRDFSALLRLGVTSNRVERSGLEGQFFTIPTTPSATRRTTSVLWGLGGQYDLDANLAFRLEFESYGRFGEGRGAGTQVTPTANFPSEAGQATIHMWSLSALYRF